MSGFTLLSAGILSLLQDQGRFGQSALGLTTGGPMDAPSAAWANRLLQNDANATLIECSVGGLKLLASIDSAICVTGAELTVRINGNPMPQWTVLPVQAGDQIELGMVSRGLRAYLAVAGGFQVTPQFGSCSTVMREGVGGLNGTKLQAGDKLPANEFSVSRRWQLPARYRPQFNKCLTLRFIEGYQADQFSPEQKQLFYRQPYQVTAQSDRMGYKLQGEAIRTDAKPLLSEGICYGAVQLPPDGQPIVLLNDRQTLGGYPKLGSVLSLDCALLAQAQAGCQLYFTPISPAQAQRALVLQRNYQHAISTQLTSL